ncbi:hypothetical protein FOA52_005865 [Chlamydomonas sp. UWO 241]|nr:hypothetical protein FOA52_005865 [Chlamydomonas sp. UWO 241]
MPSRPQTTDSLLLGSPGPGLPLGQRTPTAADLPPPAFAPYAKAPPLRTSAPGSHLSLGQPMSGRDGGGNGAFSSSGSGAGGGGHDGVSGSAFGSSVAGASASGRDGVRNGAFGGNVSGAGASASASARFSSSSGAGVSGHDGVGGGAFGSSAAGTSASERDGGGSGALSGNVSGAGASASACARFSSSAPKLPSLAARTPSRVLVPAVDALGPLPLPPRLLGPAADALDPLLLPGIPAAAARSSGGSKDDGDGPPPIGLLRLGGALGEGREGTAAWEQQRAAGVAGVVVHGGRAS